MHIYQMINYFWLKDELVGEEDDFLFHEIMFLQIICEAIYFK